MVTFMLATLACRSLDPSTIPFSRWIEKAIEQLLNWMPGHPVETYAIGFILALTAGYGVFKSTDGGTTWQRQDEMPPEGSEIYLTSLCAADTNTAWGVGPDGLIVKTVDGGSTWFPQVWPST